MPALQRVADTDRASPIEPVRALAITGVEAPFTCPKRFGDYKVPRTDSSSATSTRCPRWRSPSRSSSVRRRFSAKHIRIRPVRCGEQYRFAIGCSKAAGGPWRPSSPSCVQEVMRVARARGEPAPLRDSPTALYWSIRGSVLCTLHIREVDEQRWNSDGWQPLPATSQGLNGKRYQCQRCSSDGTAIARRAGALWERAS